MMRFKRLFIHHQLGLLAVIHKQHALISVTSRVTEWSEHRDNGLIAIVSFGIWVGFYLCSPLRFLTNHIAWRTDYRANRVIVRVVAMMLWSMRLEQCGIGTSWIQ